MKKCNAIFVAKIEDLSPTIGPFWGAQKAIAKGCTVSINLDQSFARGPKSAVSGSIFKVLRSRKAGVIYFGCLLPI